MKTFLTALAFAVLGGMASAATMTLPLNPSDFTGNGSCGKEARPNCVAAVEDPLGGVYIANKGNGHIDWNFSFTEAFNALTFSVIDANEFGKKFRVDNGDFRVTFDGKAPDGNVQLVTLFWDEAVTEASLRFNTTKGDDFSIRDASVNTVAPVPLPASGILLAGGLGLFGIMRKRRKAA